MLVSRAPTTDDLLVAILARHPGLRINELYAEVIKQLPKIGTKAVYKAVQKLERAGCIVRSARKLTLRSSYIEALQTLVEYARENSRTGLQAELASAKGTLKTTFTNLANAHRYWTHCVAALIQTIENPVVYDWVAHPWFTLIAGQTHYQFLHTLVRKKCVYHRVVGGDTSLDREALQWWDLVPEFHPLFGQSLTHCRRNKYELAIGDFTLTFELPDEAAAQIDRLYKNYRTHAVVPPLLTATIFCGPCRCRITLRADAERANAISAEILSLFKTR